MQTESQLQSLRELLFSIPGMMAVSVFLLLLVGITVSKPVRWYVVTAMLYFSTLGTFDRPWYDHTLLPPLQQLRPQSRGLIVGLLAALLIPVMTASRGWRQRLVIGGMAMYLLLELVFSARMALGELGLRGVLSAIIFMLFFLTLGLGLSKWLQTIEDAHAVIRCLAMTGVIFVAVIYIHLMIDPSSMARTRFHGTTSNPQKAAGVAALLLPPMCYLLMQREESKPWKMVLAVSTAILFLLLLWTGSRNGVLMAVVGMGLFFRTRFKKLLVVIVVVGLFALIALQVFEESTRNVERLVSTEDTRSERWSQLIDDFVGSPFIGHISDRPAIQENSYLSAAARLGMLGIVPLVGFMGLTCSALVKLQRSRSLLGEDVMLADLVTAGLVSIMVGSIFEGFLLGTVEFWVPFLYIYLSLLGFQLDAIRVYRPAA